MNGYLSNQYFKYWSRPVLPSPILPKDLLNNPTDSASPIVPLNFMESILSAATFLVKACSVVLLLLLARGLVWLFNLLVVAPLFDPLKNMPGPEASAFQSHFRDVMDPENSPTTHTNWVKEYGKCFRFHGFGRHDYRLMALDLRSVSHVLTSPVYEKPWQTRSLLGKLLGRGIFSQEGQQHKFQRKLIGPAFSTQAVRARTPVFFQKAEELRDRWDAMVPEVAIQKSAEPIPENSPDAESSGTGQSASQTVIDVSHWASRATFDVIGLAGFDYHFNSLEDPSEEVYLAYRKMFDAVDKGPGLKGILRIYFPIIERILPDECSRTTENSLRVVHEAGRKLVRNKTLAILAEKARASDIEEKDILSLLIKSNLSEDPSKRLTDAELLDQLSTFLFAGSDSTALSISYCIHLLSLNPEVQTKLREELLTLSSSSTYSGSSRESSPADSEDETASTASFSSFGSTPPSEFANSDAVDALPFLDAVVRETLRLCPPVHGTIRTATRDDVIPVSTSVSMRDGTKVEGIPIKKGSYVHIPIEGLNYSEDIWGSEDARQFNPDRWTKLPSTARASAHPGLANVMTFSFGPHGCLGWKFSVLETKIFIATLLTQFVFTPAEDIRTYNAIVTRPYVYDQWEHGSRLPVNVSRYSPA